MGAEHHPQINDRGDQFPRVAQAAPQGDTLDVGVQIGRCAADLGGEQCAGGRAVPMGSDVQGPYRQSEDRRDGGGTDPSGLRRVGDEQAHWARVEMMSIMNSASSWETRRQCVLPSAASIWRPLSESLSPVRSSAISSLRAARAGPTRNT